MHTISVSERGIERLNALLRGELAAVETYQQALEMYRGSSKADDLRRILAEHREAANTLRQHIQQFGGSPERTSGLWGAWASLVEGAAKMIGKTASLKALKEGEEHGLGDYHDALENETLPLGCKGFIRTQLLPQTQTHIRLINRMMARQD